MLKLFDLNDVRVKRSHVLNQVTKYLTENEMLPALCFVLSRKQLEICAHEITTNLLEFDSKVPYIIDRECEQLLRNKLSNFEEYLHLPEYVNMVSLLRKGIAIHHSGIIPVLKEIVELLYAKGYIKLLFATETFSIGVNMPTKTVIFTDVNKFDGNNNRILYSHEMSQMAGRAGRRGIDKVGSVFHLNNLFRNVDSVSYKTMMNGKPQTLTSKFKISYNLLLNLLDIGDNNLVNFTKKSMITGDLDNQMKQIDSEISKTTIELDNIKLCSGNLRTPKEIIEEYIDLQNKRPQSVNKKRKEIERRLEQIKDNHKFIDQDRVTLEKLVLKEEQINQLQNELDSMNNYFNSEVQSVLKLLTNDRFIEGDLNDEITLKLTLKGKFASQLRETHCLVFSRLFEDKIIDHLTSKQLVSLFSCFTNISVQEEYKDNFPKTDDTDLKDIVQLVTNLYSEYQEKEIVNKINTGIDYTIHYDLLKYVDDWCGCENIEDCKMLLQKLGSEKEVFLGEFVKALLKINNISAEMEKISEMTGNIAFLSKLREIPNMTLKYVVTNQSLYV